MENEFRESTVDEILEAYPQLPRDYESAIRALKWQILFTNVLEKQGRVLSDGYTVLGNHRKILSELLYLYAEQHCNGQSDVAMEDLCKELLYRNGINLRQRKTVDLNKNFENKNQLLSEYLSKEEWQFAIQAAVAICIQQNVDITLVMEKIALE